MAIVTDKTPSIENFIVNQITIIQQRLRASKSRTLNNVTTHTTKMKHLQSRKKLFWID